MQSDSEWCQQLSAAGLAAYHAGQDREAHGFPPKTHPSVIEVWQIGWDTGALGDAVWLGARAALSDPCPYADPHLAAAWRKGWHAVHELTLVAGTKNPAARESDARRGR